MSHWTNSSVKSLGGNADPVEEIIGRARDLVLRAVEQGWKGPPFDVFELAAILAIPSIPTEDVSEARVVSQGGKLQIEFNPTRPRRRVRFSVAHEIAHTLFPDCVQFTRNRGVAEAAGADGWQLEMLCNLAASEFLMPTGDDIDPELNPTAESLLDLQSKFDVSMEAVGIRMARGSSIPFTIAVATRGEDGEDDKAYRVDYCVPSRASSLDIPRGARLRSALLAQCTAVGYTAKGKERVVSNLPAVQVECVGIPPYPGMTYPRVMIIARGGETTGAPSRQIVMLRGNALEPRGRGPHLIAQIVNDAAPRWGGGFSLAVRERYPEAQAQFTDWAVGRGRNLTLGKVHLADVGDGVTVASLIAQHGYGASPTPRIRYGALKDCLAHLSRAASERKADVHMPRIGTGLAGGNWSVIAEIVDECLVRKGVPVTVYTLPSEPAKKGKLLGGTTRRLDEAYPEPGGSGG